MSNTNQRNRGPHIVYSFAAGLAGVAIGFLLARAIGVAPVFSILAGIALWVGAAALSKSTNKAAPSGQETSGVETLASL